MATLAIGQASGVICIIAIKAEVLALSGRLDAAEKRAILGQAQPKKEILQLSEKVDQNSAFNQSGQAMDIMRIDGREILEAVQSILDNKLDEASRREGAGIIAEMVEPLAAQLQPTEVQDMTSIMTKVQTARIGIMFKGELRDCVDATSKVAFMTVEPVVAGANVYKKIKDNMYSSTSCSEAGSVFFVNPFNPFKAEIEHDGRRITMVPRTIQFLQIPLSNSGI